MLEMIDDAFYDVVLVYSGTLSFINLVALNFDYDTPGEAGLPLHRQFP